MRRAHMQMYKDQSGQWRWRLRAPNGRIIACSGENYRRYRSAAHAARRLCGYLADPQLRWSGQA
ncbi:MAG TPA: DUF1508 domain-containing protein [Phycisphaerae bacterium]|nr:DUF1508 domain-containing protein [Phycisphaerae bacterium]